MQAVNETGRGESGEVSYGSMIEIGTSRGCRLMRTSVVESSEFPTLVSHRYYRRRWATSHRGRRDARKWDRRLPAQTDGPCHSPKSSSSGATQSATGFLRAEGAGVAARAGQERDFYEADFTNSGDFTKTGTVTDYTPGP